MKPKPKPKPKKSDSWSAIRQHLATWEKPALLTLVKELYETAAENRNFLLARCLPEESSGAALETYREKIVVQFYPKRGFGKLNLGKARKAIRDYRKATGNIPGTAELLMTYVENGVKFTNEYGDIDEHFYSRIESALDELAEILRKEKGLYPKFAKRLASAEQLTEGLGWGFHDFIVEVAWRLKEELGGT